MRGSTKARDVLNCHSHCASYTIDETDIKFTFSATKSQNETPQRLYNFNKISGRAKQSETVTKLCDERTINKKLLSPTI